MPPNVVPAWNPHQVLPPMDATNPVGAVRSPYLVTVSEFVIRYATTTERCAILNGYLTFRSELHAVGLTDGFQWVNGSFSENIEVLEARSPGDVDVVTFLNDPAQNANNLHADLTDHAWVKSHRRVDHYWVELNLCPPEELVSQAAYWYSMWSHRRNSLWKGFLKISLGNQHDRAARQALDDAVGRLAQQNQAQGGNQ